MSDLRAADMRAEVVVIPSRQMDRIEQQIAELRAQLEALAGALLGADDGQDPARAGFRAYRKRVK